MNWETYAIFAATTLEVCLTPGPAALLPVGVMMATLKRAVH